MVAWTEHKKIRKIIIEWFAPLKSLHSEKGWNNGIENVYKIGEREYLSFDGNQQKP